MTEWWSGTDAGWIGAIGGSTIGMMGGLMGLASWLWVSKGRHKPIVVGMVLGMIALGAVLLVLGVVALMLKQPYHVWYPLVLGGGISTLVFGINLPTVLNHYRRAEARRMEAESLRRS